MIELEKDVYEAIEDIVKRHRITRADELVIELVLGLSGVKSTFKSGRLLITDEPGIDALEFLKEYLKKVKVVN